MVIYEITVSDATRAEEFRDFMLNDIFRECLTGGPLLNLGFWHVVGSLAAIHAEKNPRPLSSDTVSPRCERPQYGYHRSGWLLSIDKYDSKAQ
jgi:hypothetical protein